MRRIAGPGLAGLAIKKPLNAHQSPRLTPCGRHHSHQLSSVTLSAAPGPNGRTHLSRGARHKINQRSWPTVTVHKIPRSLPRSSSDFVWRGGGSIVSVQRGVAGDHLLPSASDFYPKFPPVPGRDTQPMESVLPPGKVASERRSDQIQVLINGLRIAPGEARSSTTTTTMTTTPSGSGRSAVKSPATTLVALLFRSLDARGSRSGSWLPSPGSSRGLVIYSRNSKHISEPVECAFHTVTCHPYTSLASLKCPLGLKFKKNETEAHDRTQ